eukprot:TRINITY_DN8816_c0_g1_i1.p1 TRINITY_DN8816_c0_g1~~TRINITY_DN8816_c0_g1_i1.p1  ORF type:complete len:253 (-),score=84.02 TRINITY_DN8816_c0_g1_i1:65-823(-)
MKDRKHTQFKAQIEKEIEEKLAVPGATKLLYTIGYTYEQEAKSHLGRFFGLGTMLAETKQFFHLVKGTVGLSVASVEFEIEMQQAQADFHKKLEEAGHAMTDEDILNLQNEVQQRVMQKGMERIWKLGLVEIESISGSVVKRILTDSLVEKKQRKKYAYGIEMLGKMYQRAATKIDKEKKKSGEQENVFKHVEEHINKKNDSDSDGKSDDKKPDKDKDKTDDDPAKADSDGDTSKDKEEETSDDDEAIDGID